ncbi:tRNA-uridine aminocarboxypropyltransferase 2 [Dioscorea cayenensis subsp. rotundata]|uniref:tRNA-uridine aminocarboxypropyltransferase n=1 Tax=Dioscorea cayennensis subsp. rotundata TaxID=55577 RepID=A0AB40AJH0_DIOCR|nr:tRNA-uridine aminocarboxypropyltransferase 2 [Dioscorea cayenensis subsp. rotundata]
MDTSDRDEDPNANEPPEEEDDEEEKKQGREICFDGCGRPCSVCICSYLPPSPIPTSTHILVLHHPHELRRNRLATLPALTRSLLHLHSLSGRRLHPSSSSLLTSPSSTPLLLFPCPNSIPLSLWASQNPPSARPNLNLIVLDGTWAQAKEMATASGPFLSSIGAIQVSLEVDEGVDGESTFESELVLKKEPFKGCVSTIEAVARALRILEPEEKVGVEVEETLLRVLRAMVGFQKRHLKPIKPRPRLTKKGHLLLPSNSIV